MHFSQKKLAVFFLGFLMVSFACVPIKNTQAQEVEEVDIIRIATVEAHDLSIDSQTDNLINVSYTIYNEEGAQPDIRTSFGLLDTNGVMVYSYWVNETISLGNNESVRKKQTIPLPAFLKGDYTLYIYLANEAGLPFAELPFETITLTGSGEYVFVKDCRLTIPGKQGEWGPLFGVDVTKQETLHLECIAKNYSQSQLSLTPKFEEYWRSVFGEPLGMYARDTIFFKAGEERKIAFDLKKGDEAQAYSQIFSLVNEKQELLSNEIELHYVIQGETATVQNVVFDKSYYQMGEKATVTFGWTGSADSFLGARNPNSEAIEGMVEVSMFDGAGSSCAESQNVPFQIKNASDYIHQEVEFSVTKNCFDPKLTIAVKNTDGAILNQRTVSIESLNDDMNTKKETGILKNSWGYILFLGGGIVLLFILFFFLFRKRKSILSVILGLVVGSVGSGFIATDTVHGATYNFNTNAAGPYIVTMSFNKSVYTPGETVYTTSSIKAMTCANQSYGVSGTLSLTSPQSKTIQTWAATEFTYDPNSPNLVFTDSRCVYDHVAASGEHYVYLCTKTGSNSFTAESTPGTKYAYFKMVMDWRAGQTTGTSEGTFRQSYRVACPSGTAWNGSVCAPVINGSCGTAANVYSYNATAFSGSYCSSGTASPASPSFPSQGSASYWQCLGSNGGGPATCASYRGQPGVCGSANGGTYTDPGPSSSIHCSVGSPVSFTTNDTTFTWTCNGVYNGPSVSCSANRRRDGVCGTAAKTYTYNASSFTGSYCSVGSASPANPSFPAQGASTLWSCSGINGGGPETCASYRGQPGVCGSANGGTYTDPGPSSSIRCSVGSPVSFTTNGTTFTLLTLQQKSLHFLHKKVS